MGDVKMYCDKPSCLLHGIKQMRQKKQEDRLSKTEDGRGPA